MNPEKDVKPSVRRLAARDVLEATGLKRGDGQQKASSAVEDTIAFRIARARMMSGQDLSSGQRELLERGGVVLPQLGPATVATGTERSLDGQDVSYADDEYLPD